MKICKRLSPGFTSCLNPTFSLISFLGWLNISNTFYQKNFRDVLKNVKKAKLLKFIHILLPFFLSLFFLSLYRYKKMNLKLKRNYNYHYFPHLRVFHTNVNWWFSNVVSMNDSKFPEIPSQYSSRSKQCYRWDGHNLSSYSQVLQFLHECVSDSTERANYDWNRRYFYVL